MSGLSEPLRDLELRDGWVGGDEEAVQNEYNIIKEENSRGATILLTSHHKVDIVMLCDDVKRVNDGVVSLI